MVKEPRRVGATEADVDGRGIRIAIAASEYHREITGAMLEQAQKEAMRLGATVQQTVRVPGVYDLPLAVQSLLKHSQVDAVVALGAVVKGETDHDQVITQATCQTLQELALAHQKPVGLGVTGPGETLAQAEARVDRAADAVRAVVQMVVRLRAL